MNNQYRTSLIILSFITILNLSAYSQAKFFTKDELIKTKGIVSDDQIYGLDVFGKQTTITYEDGQGRAIQNVALAASPNRKDIIQTVLYNNLGQKTQNLLPYVGQDGSGSYRTDPVNEQASYYANRTQDKVADDSAPYNQVVFENSPLARLLRSGMVGAGYQPAGTLTNQHFKTLSYRPNASATDGNIVIWGTGGTDLGNYADNSLSVTDNVDEEGMEALSYNNSQGQVVLKRQKNGAKNIDTYFIYNNSGNLSYVIPPLAIQKMITSANFDLGQLVVRDLIYKYLYDTRGRLIQKKLPSAGVVSIVYDPVGRPVLIQDGKLSASNQWNYLKYDSKKHVISQGLYTDNNAAHIGQGNMQQYVNSLAAAYSTNWYEKKTAATATGYYTNVVFPTLTSAMTPLSYAYFDDYDPDGDGTANYTYSIQSLNQEAQPFTTSLKGVNTILRTRTVGQGLSDIWLTKVFFYDKNGHLVQTQSNNHLNYTDGIMTDYSSSSLSFTGIPLQTKVIKAAGASNTTSILSTFAYDHMQRLSAIDQTYRYNSTPPLTVTVANYIYNELGQLVKKNLQPRTTALTANITLDGTSSVASGSTSNVSASNSITLAAGFVAANGSVFTASINSSALQSIDFRYNIRGQLTSLNNSKLSDDSGTLNTNDSNNDFFGIQYLYDTADNNLGNIPYYNGKISAVKWMSKDVSGAAGNERSFRYSYDGVDRYTGGSYAERSSASTGIFGLNIGAFNENGITYDDGGNILSVKRSALGSGGGAALEFDNLQYSYDPANPNQLKAVTDAPGANYTGYGFRNLSGTTSGTYVYDQASGNLVADPYKSLSITYNLLNRPDRITITSGTGKYINYTYNASGNLIRKQQFDNSATPVATTDYLDGFVYLNGNITYFPMPEGRVRNAGSGGSVKFRPEYVIADQQGNARLSFEEDPGVPGVPVVRQENSYYGFGMTMPGSLVPTPGADNRQLYNGGSELQKDFDPLPDYYQTFYRNYDPELGRFVSVDPKQESSADQSPYQYAQNNPISFNDPLGDYQQAARILDPFREAYANDFDFIGGGGGRSGSGGPEDFGTYNRLIEEAKNGSTLALQELGMRFGVTFYGNSAKQLFKEITGMYTLYTIVKGAIMYATPVSGSAFKDTYRLALATDPNDPNHYNDYLDLSDKDANELLGRTADERSIDWRSMGEAGLSFLGGAVEFAAAATGEWFSGGLATPVAVGLAVDGGARMTLAFGKFVASLSGTSGRKLPGNLGGVIGLAIDNIEGTSNGQLIGTLVNDAVTIIITGGLTGTMTTVLDPVVTFGQKSLTIGAQASAYYDVLNNGGAINQLVK